MNLVNVVLDRQEVIQHYNLRLRTVPGIANTVPHAGYWFIIQGHGNVGAHIGCSLMPEKYRRIITEGIFRGDCMITDQDPFVASSVQVLFRTQSIAQQALDNLHKYLIKRDTR